MRISSFTIVFLIISIVVVVFGALIVSMNNNYDEVFVNETQLETFDKIEELNSLASEMNESLTQIQSNNPLDVVGGLLTSGFTVMKTTWTSFGVYTDVTSDAVDNANLGETSGTFKNVLLIIGILLFIFAMVGILTGRVI